MADKKLIQKSFWINIKVMKLVGLYPYDTWPKIFTVYAYVFYFLFTVPTPLLAAVHLIVVKETDMKKISDGFYMFCEIGALMVKLLPIKNHPEAVRRTIQWLDEDIFQSYLPEQDHIMTDAINMCRKIYNLFLAFCITAIFAWPSKIFLYEDRRLPMDIWLPFNATEDIRVYLAVFFFMYLGVVTAVLSNSALDTLIGGLIYHAAGQIKILKDSLQFLSRRVDEQVAKESATMNDGEKERLRASLIYKKICECIDHYDAIDKFVKDLEETYSFVIFTQFLVSIVVICACCLQLLLMEPLSVPFFAMIVYVVAVLLEIFLYCYNGAILYEESNTVITAIYMSDWYNYDEKSKKALITLMERAKRPMMVTAGKLLDLSLETFVMIVRRSYSLLAVLKNY